MPPLSEQAPQAVDRSFFVEELGVPEHVRASKVEVARLCERFASGRVSVKELAAHGISKDLFEKIKLLAEGELKSAHEWETWEGIAHKVIPIFSAVIEDASHRSSELRERHALVEIHACDARALELLSPKVFSPAERVDLRMKMEALSTGRVIERKRLGNVQSTNAPSRCIIDAEDGNKLVAYVKSRLDETAFKMEKQEEVNEKGESVSRWHTWRRIFDRGRNEHRWVTDDGLTSLVGDDEQKGQGAEERLRQFSSQGFGESVRALLAKELGVSPEEVPYYNTELTARAGVLPGEMTKREWAVSRFDLLLGLKLVPLTVVRPEHGFTDIASVQEAVPSVDEDHPARELTQYEGVQLFERPPEEWADVFPSVKGEAPVSSQDRLKQEPVRSMVRMAAFAYLMGDLDGIEVNCMIDPVTKSFSKIDNGLSWGLLTGKAVKFNVPIRRGSPKMVEENKAELLRSAPLELILKHKKLVLDEEARTHFQDLYARLGADSPERDQVLGLLSVMFGDYGQKMVENQFAGFMSRLDHLVKHGRPPRLEAMVDYEPDLQWAALSLKNSSSAKAA